MRIQEPLVAFVEAAELGLGAGANGRAGGLLVHQLAAAKERDEEVFVFGTLGDVLRAGWDPTRRQSRGRARRLVEIVDQVADKGAVGETGGSAEGRASRSWRLLGQLDAWLPGAARIADGAELVDAAERGLIVRGDQARADAPDGDPRALLFRLAMICSSRSLLATIAALGKPASSSMRRASMLSAGEIAGVEPDAGQLVALRAQLVPDCDRVAHALDRVVGIDEEDGSCSASPRRRRGTLRARRRRT